jgi:hypothetical protein
MGANINNQLKLLRDKRNYRYVKAWVMFSTYNQTIAVFRIHRSLWLNRVDSLQRVILLRLLEWRHDTQPNDIQHDA